MSVQTRSSHEFEVGTAWTENRKKTVEMIKAPDDKKTIQKRILLVDDEKGFRETLRDLVESVGYLCAEADSGDRALELLRRTHFSIVISDIVMREMDGLELLHLIKKRYSDVDVLIITGHQGKYSPSKIIQAGASDFLEKPFTLDQLAARLSRIEKEKALRNRLFTSAITDELTGLHNRRHFYRRLKQETQRAKRQGYPLSIIMFDVDGFKRFNDRYGHLKGDALLKTVARVLRLSVRENVDSAFRYGGDEFVVILPEAESKTALSIGTRTKVKFKDTAPGGLTLSMGVAQFGKDFDTETFVHLVDERMYNDKQKSKELGHPQLEIDLGKDNYYIRCLTCGGLVHWAAPLCENCLADPRREIASEKGQNIAREFLRKPPHPAEDRRKTPRVRMRKTFLYDDLQATIQNISREGVQIRSKTSFFVGKVLKMAFSLEDGIGRFVGSVVYVQPLSEGNLLAGVKFGELSDKDSLLLERFLDSRSFKTEHK